MEKQRNNYFSLTFFLVCIICAAASSVNAEVYRWVDENGKVHYSDKKPKEQAEDISAEIKKQNIDSSIEEQQKLQQIFRPENDADRAHRERLNQQSQPSNDQIKYCNEQRKYLRDISGPVYFVDKDGKDMKVTERERQAEEARVRQLLQERCSS